MTPPRPAALCLDPRPRLRVGPGAPRPHSPRRTAGLGNRLERASERARRRARVGGAASKPRSRESERRGGGGAAGGRALLPPAPLALWPPGGGDPASSELRRESRGPGSRSRPCAPLILREAASGAPEWYALGPGRRRTRRRTGFQGPLPRPRPPTCPRPRPPPSCAQWVHSFLLVRSTNIYRVPTGCPPPNCAPGAEGGDAVGGIRAGPTLPGRPVRTGEEA